MNSPQAMWFAGLACGTLTTMLLFVMVGMVVRRKKDNLSQFFDVGADLIHQSHGPFVGDFNHYEKGRRDAFRQAAKVVRNCVVLFAVLLFAAPVSGQDLPGRISQLEALAAQQVKDAAQIKADVAQIKADVADLKAAVAALMPVAAPPVVTYAAAPMVTYSTDSSGCGSAVTAGASACGSAPSSSSAGACGSSGRVGLFRGGLFGRRR